MAVILLRKSCPFCDEYAACSVSEYFHNHYNLRRHIKRTHGYDLPSRKRSDQIKKALVYNEKKIEKYPNAVVAYGCPCCIVTLPERQPMKLHIEQTHVISVHKLEELHDMSEWMIDNVNILSTFYEYSRSNRLQQTEMRFLVKKDAEKILLPGTFKSAVSAISEAELLASYVHPFMQALFSGWEPQRVPHASDKVFNGEKITNNARHDYIVDVYKQVNVRYANVIGELKVEGASKRDIAKDFYRVALLTKEVMDKNMLAAAMGFQDIGIHVYRTM
ncbi:hypothetical protein G6F43_010582 [Rhizopus delemar]|nr:hypothetical protein G6F43_010582 [Rhizopus delemar]